MTSFSMPVNKTTDWHKMKNRRWQIRMEAEYFLLVTVLRFLWTEIGSESKYSLNCEHTLNYYASLVKLPIPFINPSSSSLPPKPWNTIDLEIQHFFSTDHNLLQLPFLHAPQEASSEPPGRSLENAFLLGHSTFVQGAGTASPSCCPRHVTRSSTFSPLSSWRSFYIWYYPHLHQPIFS